MQRSSASAFPTITFEEALRREREYRKRLDRTHPHLLTALNGAPEQQKEVGTDSVTVAFKRKLAPENSVPQQQSSFSCSAVQRQPGNWYPLKKKVKVPHPPSHIQQCPRPNVVPSFWCKICKVDCVTEFNFGAHIGGKKHKAKKLEILGNRNTGRPGSECSGNRNPVQNSHAVSGSRNNETNVSSGIVCADLSSDSRTNVTEESGCTNPPMSSLDFTAI
ncbi:hypothetical protein SEVIR_9G281500v4 [Setaria viridis]|uniref:C2H2-type domain-containing protein n=1 Tax=Setaria viridis TaxID=4556 RepID=A0A4U6SYU6_SETVI|nr:uncharacterized protein LOC117838986 [Setaria viridis]XP_034575099.1 uncharacterized protein LOC117838986 [Setaria viridis]TKV94249.1 hypothetical protein SEVIR_9G281500v2 [Setaria viridis]